MSESKFSTRKRSVRPNGAGRVVAFGCALLVLLAAAGMGYAQAGRRVAKPKSDPPVPKSSEPAAPVAAQPTPEPEKISLLVVGSLSPSMRFSLGVVDNLPGVVGRRLQDSRRLQVASGGEMSRGEANKRAKEAGSKTYVVWIELESRGFDADPSNSRARIDDLSVRYVVLEPGTGKQRDQGSIHLQPVRGGILGGIRRVPPCYPQPSSNLEYSLTVAGIETAERIFRAFSLPSPPLCS
jgi:hypothetical protein